MELSASAFGVVAVVVIVVNVVAATAIICLHNAFAIKIIKTHW